MVKDDCIFCKLANKVIPTEIVYENDEVMAFNDPNPQMPVHVLIVPKEHYANIGDDVPADLLGKLFAAVREVARIKGIEGSGYRVLVNTGDDAGQVVKHLHVHVLGGAPMNDGNPSLA